MLMACSGLFLLTGCAVLTDRPGPGNYCAFADVDSGCPIATSTAATLNPGVATYALVVSELGPPLLLFDDSRVIGYAWETHSGSYRLSPWNPKMHPLRQRIRAFALVFDERQILQRHAYFAAKESESLRKQVLTWAKSPPKP